MIILSWNGDILSRDRDIILGREYCPGKGMLSSNVVLMGYYWEAIPDADVEDLHEDGQNKLHHSFNACYDADR